MNGATLTTDRNGANNSAYSFNGVDNEITIPSFTQFDVNENFSISLWFKTSVSCGSTAYCGGMLSQMGATTGANNGIGYQLGYDNTGLWKFEYNTLNPPQLPIHFYNSTQILDGTWHNIIVIVDKVNETISLFNDGVLEGTVSQAWFNNSTLNDNPLFFGMLREQNYYYGGDLDDVGIWNRALTECEIADIYNSQLGFLNTSSTQTETALDSYTWSVNNQTYTQSGTYTAVIPNEAGCDSTITLDLTMQFTGIEELIQSEKELVKIVDLTGRETPFKPNTPLIFIYSDGTRERVMKLEE